jgi:hypothetical protein
MLIALLKRVFSVFQIVSFGSSGPGAIPKPTMVVNEAGDVWEKLEPVLAGTSETTR